MREDLGSIQQQPVVGLSFMADDNTLLAIKIIFIITADQFGSLDFHHFCSILNFLKLRNYRELYWQ